MRVSISTLLLAGAVIAAPVFAQPPNGPRPGAGRQGGPQGPRPEMNGQMMQGPGPGAPRPDVASMFLAHTGELKLTDAQVTRLAGVSRRTADRHRAMRARMDSLAGANPPARIDSAGRARMMRTMEQMRPQMEAMREQERTDVRDALAVLTPDQLAQAWEMRGEGPRGGGQNGVRAHGGPGGTLGMGMHHGDGPQPRRPQN